MKKIISLAMLVSFIVGFKSVHAAVPAVVEQYEIRAYDPQKMGLKDLVFEARIDNLTETLTKLGNFGTLSDLHFKIYWISPGQYKIDVNGLPKGFAEVRSDLSMLIQGKLEFVIPEMFSSKFQNAAFTSENTAEGTLLTVSDPSSVGLNMPGLNVLFDKAGKLKSISNPMGAQNIRTEFFTAPKAWSQNKLVLDKIVTITTQGIQKSVVTNALQYATVSGMGFPTTLKISNVIEAKMPAHGKEKEKVLKQETGSVIKFTNYEVNTGKAQRYMKEGLKR